MDERELNWNDSIEDDGGEYEILPEGDYDFEVTKFERGRSKGSDKLPPCNMAILSIKLSGGGKIGQKRKGEKVTMNWAAVLGAKGKCKVGIRKYKKQNGEDGEANEILKFYEAQSAAPARRFTAGTF